MHADALRGHLDGMLLAVVAREPLHGYAVIEELRGCDPEVLDLPEGTVYPALHRLERGGMLDSSWVVVAGRRRRVYSVTARGRRALRDRRSEWRRFAGAVDSVLAASS